MQYESYELRNSILNYNAFPQAKCMECFPGLVVPFEIQMFPCLHHLILVAVCDKTQIHEMHSCLEVFEQVSIYSKICPKQN